MGDVIAIQKGVIFKQILMIDVFEYIHWDCFK